MLDKMGQHIVTDEELDEMVGEQERLIAANKRLRAEKAELASACADLIATYDEERGTLDASPDSGCPCGANLAAGRVAEAASREEAEHDRREAQALRAAQGY